jgi:hypothetical protein
MIFLYWYLSVLFLDISLGGYPPKHNSNLRASAPAFDPDLMFSAASVDSDLRASAASFDPSVMFSAPSLNRNRYAPPTHSSTLPAYAPSFDHIQYSLPPPFFSNAYLYTNSHASQNYDSQPVGRIKPTFKSKIADFNKFSCKRMHTWTNENLIQKELSVEYIKTVPYGAVLFKLQKCNNVAMQLELHKHMIKNNVFLVSYSNNFAKRLNTLKFSNKESQTYLPELFDQANRTIVENRFDKTFTFSDEFIAIVFTAFTDMHYNHYHDLFNLLIQTLISDSKLRMILDFLSSEFQTNSQQVSLSTLRCFGSK